MNNLKKLEKWYWSPRHPLSYTVINPETDQPAGVGVLLAKRPDMWTSFNLTWAEFGDRMLTWNGASEAVGRLVGLAQPMKRAAEGGTLGELSCLLSQEDFFNYCSKNNVKLGLPKLRRA